MTFHMVWRETPAATANVSNVGNFSPGRQRPLPILEPIHIRARSGALGPGIGCKPVFPVFIL
jgi:hypothetical protein